MECDSDCKNQHCPARRKMRAIILATMLTERLDSLNHWCQHFANGLGTGTFRTCKKDMQKRPLSSVDEVAFFACQGKQDIRAIQLPFSLMTFRSTFRTTLPLTAPRASATLAMAYFLGSPAKGAEEGALDTRRKIQIRRMRNRYCRHEASQQFLFPNF